MGPSSPCQGNTQRLSKAQFVLQKTARIKISTIHPILYSKQQDSRRYRQRQGVFIRYLVIYVFCAEMKGLAVFVLPQLANVSSAHATNARKQKINHPHQSAVINNI